MVGSINYSSSDDKPVQMKPVRVLLQDILRKSQEGTNNEEKSFTCILCSKPFSSKSNLTRHVRIHIGKKPFSCTICHKMFSQSGELKSHMRIHTGEKPFSCIICNKRFAHKCHAKSHMQTHTGEKLHSYSHCDKSYGHHYSLKSHIMSQTYKNPYSDRIEESKIITKNVSNALQNTVSHDMVSVKVKKCEGLVANTCENTSLGMMEMVDKQRRHNLADNSKFVTKQPNTNGKIGQEPKVNRKTYACSICMKSFPVYCRLKAHMQKHAKMKPFTCSVCSKTFSERSNLGAHLRIHRGEKPYSCLICKKLFSQRSNMKAHMRTHSGEKPFSCSYCNKTFTQRFRLKVHILIHTRGTGEMYSCSHCCKSYLLKDSLKKHILSHSRETFPLSSVGGVTHSSRMSNLPQSQRFSSFSRLEVIDF